MKIATRLKVASTGTSAAVLTLGAASTDSVTMPQAVAAGELAVGDTGVPFAVKDGAGNWENSYFTITSNTVITRERVCSSSAGGAAPTYSGGALSVACTPFGFELSYLPDPNDVGFDIWLMVGQSNMCGRGVLDSLTDFADSRVYQFGGANGDSAHYQTIFSGANPIHNVEGVNTGKNSPQVPFANTYAGMTPPNRKILLVPCASGGTTMVGGDALWAPGSPGGVLFENAISQANAAIVAAKAMYPKSRFVGTAMHLGESDTQETSNGGVSTAQFVAAGKTFISLIRSRVTGASESLFVIGGLAPGFISTYGNKIDLAHKQLAQEVRKCVFAAGPAGFDDATHYDARGVRLLGAAMGLAIPAAKLNPGMVVNASTLTLALSSSSVVSGSPVTVTVGTDNPLTGAQTESVALTAPVAGTWSQNPVTLNASAPTAAPTFTPSATGSGNITAAATGTPTITGASKAFASTAAATAPGAPTIGTATAGDTTASFAFTAPASNGGAAIDGYRLKVYKATDDTLVGTFTGTSSPLAATGLTNGVAVYGKVEAHNSVGYGAQSAASNSVSPAAAAATATTWNAADKNASLTLSNGNLTVAGTTAATDNWHSVRANVSKSAGKWYFEVAVAAAQSGGLMVGVGGADVALDSFVGSTATSWGYFNATGAYQSGTVSGGGTPATYGAADVIGVAFDADAGTVDFYKNNVLQGVAHTSLGKPAFPMLSTRDKGAPATVATVNFGATAFAYAPPSGYSRIDALASAGSYTTMNPADKNSEITLTGGNLQADWEKTHNASGWETVRSVAGKAAGKWYFEAKMLTTAAVLVGVADSALALTDFVGSTANSVGYYSTGNIYRTGGGTGGTPATYVANDIIGVALDMDNKTVQFFKNGVSQGTVTGLAAATMYAAVTGKDGSPGTSVLMNFGASTFAYAPPSGFVGLS